MKIYIDRKNQKDIIDCRLDDDAIRQVMKDIAEGRIDADIGGGLIKQRIARGNRGKSKGCRGLIILQSENILILVHIFSKGSKENISSNGKKDASETVTMLSRSRCRSNRGAGKVREMESDRI